MMKKEQLNVFLFSFLLCECVSVPLHSRVMSLCEIKNSV